MMNKLILFLFLLIATCVHAQNRYCNENIYFNNNVNSLRIVFYPEDYVLRKIKSPSGIKTQEDLLQNFISVNNRKWLEKISMFNENFDDAAYNRISKTNSKDYYAQPQMRLTFRANGIEYCLIKFHLFDDNVFVLSHSLFMKKINNKWLASYRDPLLMTVFLRNVKIEYLRQIFSKEDIQDSYLKGLVGKYKRGRINIDEIVKKINIEIGNGAETIKHIQEDEILFLPNFIYDN